MPFFSNGFYVIVSSLRREVVDRNPTITTKENGPLELSEISYLFPKRTAT